MAGNNSWLPEKELNKENAILPAEHCNPFLTQTKEESQDKSLNLEYLLLVWILLSFVGIAYTIYAFIPVLSWKGKISIIMVILTFCFVLMSGTVIWVWSDL